MTRLGIAISLFALLGLTSRAALAADAPAKTSASKSSSVQSGATQPGATQSGAPKSGSTKSASGKSGSTKASSSADAAKKATGTDAPVADDAEDGLETEGAQHGARDPDAAWRKAATPEAQNEARAYFRQGNELVKESLFVQAIASYDKALEYWDHPAIHYNLALALLNLDQPVRLRQELLGSLKFGPEALGEDKAKRVEQYLKLVEGQLTELSVHSEHTGAKVELDGKVIFTAPGEYREFVEPGSHRVKATAPGLEPTERPLTLIAGEPTDVKLELYASEDWIRYKRRWKPLGPIAVTASGAVIAAAGGVLFWLGGKQIDDFDADVTSGCPGGCPLEEVGSSPDSGKALQVAGVATMAAGGAVLLTGGLLLYMNRKIPYRVDPSLEEVNASGGPSVSFSPVVTPNFVGIGSRGTF